ncbi:hypothetical protein [Encephalitozoon cuniculi GB-M1]|uniref:Uncharacterized protein n=1 Tax=Encephalitozoon cuniculi (strain GB-M1) TaxID=284813 RepID=Q8SWG9_ENCCU|nr:uncharacterized protein ECU02_0130 [Encephalitozoon cuniculi GB-M1]CAD25044.1 hypothetical protein [Encephalitozoon cuniculi GB-M1]
MDLVRYLGNALENTRKAFEVSRLKKEVEDNCKGYRDLVFSQRHIDSQMENKEKRALVELEICKALRRFHEYILRESLKYTEAIHLRMKGPKDTGDLLSGDTIGNIEERHYKKQISILLSCLCNNVYMADRLVEFEEARRYSDDVENARNETVGSINRLGMEILRGIEGVIKHHSKDRRERLDMMLMHENLRIQSLLRRLGQRLNEHEEAIGKEIISKVLLVLSQGSIENDVRLVKLIDKTIERAEKYESPEIAQMSIQFVIAKKYVEDIISLKEQPFLRKCLERRSLKKDIGPEE